METENKILHYNIKELKNKQKQYQKKINDHQNQLDFLENKSKEKQQEIQILIKQLNELRKTVSMGIYENDDSELKKYIQNLIAQKNYNNIKQNSKDNENSKENDQKSVIQKESEKVNQKEYE